MNSKQRPMSPFMLGPYYKPQITSVLSILHRATGVALTVIGVPLLMWWLIALGQGPESYSAMQECLSGILGLIARAGLVFCLSFHLFNGIRHLFWDIGKGFELKSVYLSGWLVIIGTVLLTGIVMGVTL